ncbi:MAG: hypothetical protein JWO82_2651, partial [Akkermansiaceae bacterium]|nr:hypothetical protein [Akkermansiaceae bacterium]
GSYVKRMAKLTTGQLGWGDAIASPYIQRRLHEMPPVVRQALAGLSTGTPNHLKHQVARIGQLIGGADALFTAGTYAMVYDYQKTVVAKDLRLKGAEAEAFAHTAAEREVDRVAQPMRMGARSLFENTSTNPAMKLAWAFASEPRQKLALMVYAAAKLPMKQKLRAVAQAYFFGGVVSSIIRAAVRDSKDSGDELFDERNWNPKLLALQAATSPLKGIPFVGDAVESGLYKAFKQYLPEGNLFSVPVRAVEGGVHLVTQKNRTADTILKDTEAIISGFGVGSENATAGASVMHILRDLFSIGKNVSTAAGN